jgi:hypothetical protein
VSGVVGAIALILVILLVALVVAIVLMVLYLRREKEKQSITSGMQKDQKINFYFACTCMCPIYYDIAGIMQCYCPCHAKSAKDRSMHYNQ